MTENQKAWLKAMYDDAILGAVAAAANERTAAAHATSAESYFARRSDEDENAGYIRILERLKAQVDSPDMQKVLT